MNSYMILKSIHMTSAYLTIALFLLCVILDAVGKPGWRTTPLRWIPHANNTVLLVAAIGLLIVGPWMVFVDGWVTAKLFLLVGYIGAGAVALKDTRRKSVRVIAGVLAIVQLLAILHLALAKPF
ncbi:SirB2 family protein [Marinobacter confluentis]|uniref:Invasion protein n=1 Tax=Marinobacter confluentis TaxID=1697557 RepID=A0A4Z1C9Z3_9GAMM|nr:SirB2 family protein [Marinobacter confluentis]TGN40463.1 invasion protein [Marinobacter confluentis]